MNEMTLTDHAAARMHQRAIPPLIVKWLLQYGAAERSGGGTEMYYFTRDSRRRLARDVGDQVVNRLAALLDAYVVISDSGAVITAGHRFRRIQRDHGQKGPR